MRTKNYAMSSGKGNLVGETIGSYQLESLLGEGGMGTVYRALDTRLQRPVAIKLLSNALADAAARRRFQREAQMASALNHPHILTVHDIGEFEGRQYLVTEFLDGGTLRQWAKAEPRSWRQIVELMTGVADGLATAHNAGILHRDIKPENILVTKSGYAKLADFGLAKLYEVPTSQDATRTVSENRTRPGDIVGTVAYMSPEQATGRLLDQRSDIFSFGIVLYELLTGRRPFSGPSDVDVLHGIAHRSCEPLPASVPAPIRVLVEKALEKDPADRFQSMRDVVIDLRRAVRQSADTSLGWATKAHLRRTLTLLSVATALGLIAMFVARSAIGSRQREGASRAEYTQLTHFVESATSPAISPDGRMLAFIRGESTFYGPGQIYVKLLPDGEPVQLTHDDSLKMAPKFTRDGARISYTSLTDVGWNTWIVPVLGGQPPRLLLANAEGLTWIDAGADQPRLLFSEMTGRDVQMGIVTANESRAQHRVVYMPPETEMAHRSYLSPDRKQVLLIQMGYFSWLPCRLVPFDGTSPGRLVGPIPSQCTDAAWSRDGHWMYFSANAGNGVHIWRQRFPDGTPEQITSGVTDEEGIEFAPDGRSFVTSIGTRQSAVWVHDSRGERQITSEGYAMLPSFSADGKKLYYLLSAPSVNSYVSGALWVADLETGQRQRLLPDFRMQNFDISSDGKRVVFIAASDTEQSPLWIAALDGGSPPRRLVEKNAWQTKFGGAGEVIFSVYDERFFIYRVREDGRGRQKVTQGSAVFGVSPDGQWIATLAPTTAGLSVYPIGGGAPTLICRTCAVAGSFESGPWSDSVRWTPDGKFFDLKFGMSTYAIPLKAGQMLPPTPRDGFQKEEEVARLPGARLIGKGETFVGPDPAVYAFTKVAIQRNIYRVPVPDAAQP